MLGPASGEVLLNETQAARILGVTQQAVSGAIYRGTLPATHVGKQKKVPLSAVIAYGVKQGQPVEVLMQRARKELQQQIDWEKLAVAVIAAIGLGALLKYVTRGHAAHRYLSRHHT